MAEKVPQICFFCEHWKQDTVNLSQIQKEAAFSIMSLETATSPEKIPLTYGKCKAVTTNSDNEIEVMDQGTLSTQDCNVYDRDGYPAFSPIPME